MVATKNNVGTQASFFNKLSNHTNIGCAGGRYNTFTFKIVPGFNTRVLTHQETCTSKEMTHRKFNLFLTCFGIGRRTTLNIDNAVLQ